MKQDLAKIGDIDPHYFWDVDVDNLDVISSKRLIIERVFSLGTSNEIRQVIIFYGREKVVDVLTNLNFLDPKTLNFVSKFFNLPLKTFKCHRRKQSIPEL